MNSGILADLKRVKGWLWWRGMGTLDTLAYSGWLPRRWTNKRTTAFWERQASAIHEQWGGDRSVS